MRTLAAFFASLLLSVSASAVPGETQQIDNTNLLSFRNVLPTDCTSYQADPTTTIYVADGWFSGQYRDATSLTRNFAFKVEGTWAGSCDSAKQQMMNSFATNGLFFTDVRNGTPKIARGGETCFQDYIVATLGNEITLPDGTKADEAQYVSAERATKCP